MAISPKQAIKAEEENVKDLADRAEREADEWIKTKATPQREDILWSASGYSQKVLEVVMRRFRDVGWRVQRDSDRDGFFLRFIFPVYRSGHNAGIHPVARPKC